MNMKKQTHPSSTRAIAMDGQGVRPSGPRPTAAQLAATRQTYVVSKASGSVVQQTLVTKAQTGKSR